MKKFVAATIFSLSALVPNASSAVEKYVDIWFRSFIGNKHPQIKDYVKNTTSGKYVIEAPFIPAPNFMDIGRLTGTCFTTDQRDFSDALDASARVGIYLRIYVEGREIRIGKIDGKPNIIIGTTRNVDCVTGKDLAPPMTATESDVTITDVKPGEFLRNFSVRSAVGDPFYKVLGIRVSPSISFEILFSYKVSSKQLKINGSIESFPWFEGYYKKNGGKITRIINSPPQGSATALSLIDLGMGLNARNFEDTIDLLEWK